MAFISAFWASIRDIFSSDAVWVFISSSFISSICCWATYPAAASNYVLQVYTTSTTWNKQTGLKAVKVTVIGGGGNGGNVGVGTAKAPTAASGSGGAGGLAISYVPAASLGASETVTVGNVTQTSSFGSWASATGAANVATSSTTGSTGGTGTGTGTSNLTVQGQNGGSGGVTTSPGGGGMVASAYGVPGFRSGTGAAAGGAARGYGAGGGGTFSSNGVAQNGGAGAPGLVIVEEFY